MPPSPSRAIESISTAELYDRWAKIYDTEDNILQALDDHYLPPLLDHALALFPPNEPITVTELGTGTGRNTLKLLSITSPPISQITCLDFSPSMLSIAQSRLSARSSPSKPTVTYTHYNALSPPSSLPAPSQLLLSTLVLEHLPLATFFANCASLLLPNGFVVLTNMHPHLGSIGQASFNDEETGKKVRGESWAYGMQEVVDCGKEWGFELVGEWKEGRVQEEDLQWLGEGARRWVGWGIWFGMVLRSVGKDGSA